MEREPPSTSRPHDLATGALPGRAPLAPRPGAPPPDAVAPERERAVGLLFRAWLVYWTVLLAVQGWPVARALWRIRQSGGKGSFSVSYDGGLLEAALWLAGPPLLMALAWLLWTRRRR